MAGRSTRVFLLDDHEVVRRGIRSLLELEPDIEVVGEAATAGEAVGRILATSPDVALIDVLLPDGDGVTVCREVRSRRPEIRVLMLTSMSDDEALFDSIMAGASGYVLKQVRGFDLVDAVHRLAAGQSPVDPAMTGAALERLRERVDARRALLPELSGRDRRILELIAEGRTNRQIGEQVHLSEKTVKNHVSALLHHLGLHRRTEAAVLVARQDALRVPSYAHRADEPASEAGGSGGS